MTTTAVTVPGTTNWRTGDESAMTGPDPSRLRVTIHLVQQSTVNFAADELWPMHGAYGRFGYDLPSFAEEVTRRLHADGYIGYILGTDQITVIPLNAIKRVDFSNEPTAADLTQ